MRAGSFPASAWRRTPEAALAALAIIGLSDAAAAGAWPMEEGRVQAITAIAYDYAEQAYDDDGDVTLEADFEKIESSTFIEWGVTPRLTLPSR